MKRVLCESLIVAVIGLVLALAANGLSPRGLKLSRDYFPPPPPAPPSPQISATTQTNKPSYAEILKARLDQRGLRLGDSNRIYQLYSDPRYAQGLLAFIDARDDAHFQAGHVPSAIQLDYYHPENYLAAVMPAAMIAQEIVVYCNGGDCEDSELAATLLTTGGIPSQKLIVYGGGFGEWKTNGWPVEIGARNSGQLTNYFKPTTMPATGTP